MADALRAISEKIRATAFEDGQDVAHAAVYVNYALFGTLIYNLYGDNVERLQEISKAYDPHGVMSLTGGWKF